MALRDLSEKIEQYVVEIINGHRRTGCAKYIRHALFILSRLYHSAVQLRLALYNEGILRQHVLGCFVISVGNLTTGGTGKTPVVELLAKTLMERGKRVAVLSRGYRSKPRPWWYRMKALFSGNPDVVPPRLVSDGTRVLLDSAQSGDEPFMLAQNLKGTDERRGAMVVVDKNRFKGGIFAIDRGADTLILDDGFQYLRLRPWTNILLVDSTNPFHNHEMLPCGMLRDPIENLKRADYIFLTKCDGRDLHHLRRFLKRHNQLAEIIECNHVPKYLQGITDESRQPLDYLKGKKVASISAIAVPESFNRYLRQLGATIVYQEHFADHHRYHKKELAAFGRNARKAGAELILTTEKDAVRFPEMPAGILPAFFLRVEIIILKGEEAFNRCIAQICLG
ncbi:MAG: tetraacyldisaccharide 4'-kinase [Lentisphaeria bacterium]|nr:tetraacyldisaccharide 4'-kinase [Lentisphaeria bacterium]